MCLVPCISLLLPPEPFPQAWTVLLGVWNMGYQPPCLGCAQRRNKMCVSCSQVLFGFTTQMYLTNCSTSFAASRFQYLTVAADLILESVTEPIRFRRYGYLTCHLYSQYLLSRRKGETFCPGICVIPLVECIVPCTAVLCKRWHFSLVFAPFAQGGQSSCE